MKEKINLEKGAQEKVWDKIAPFWNKYKTVRVGEKDSLIDDFIDKDDLVLDAGCGSGRNFYNLGKWKAVDFSSEMVKFSREKAKEFGMDIEIVKSNLSKLPFSDGVFDKVLCFATLHCLEEGERKAAVREFARVLKQGGKILISVWNKDSKKWKNKEKEKFVAWALSEGENGKEEVDDEKFESESVLRYYYLFNPEELVKLFELNGFKPIKLNHSKARNIVAIFEKI